MKNQIQKFGKALSGMVMPNIGAFIAWGFITALFIEKGWIPNAQLASLVSPMLTYLLPILIAITGGKMIGGDRGGVIAGIATMGVIVGSDITMFIGAMAMGPFAGWIIKKFDKAVEGKIPAGFEMLVNNFSVGILGMILAIIGYYAVGPAISAVTAVLSAGVAIIVAKGLLPLVSIFIEPAKVLFLNNALNHGILSPIGTEQALETGKSIMYMLEANPGPGLGVLVAYWLFAKGSVKDSAPGAAIIHFFGGIHEIYFPYILMNPVVILAPICGSAAAILFYTVFGAGLVGPASPGSIIAFMAMSPKGEQLIVLGGVLIAAAVSFVVASPLVKRAASRDKEQDLDKAKEQMLNMKSIKKDSSSIRKIVFACDAGMGSSAMGATKFRNRIKALNTGIVVTNTSVDNIPSDTDVVVCQITLADRAKKSAPTAEHIFIENFLQDKNLDALYERLATNKAEQPVEKAEPAKTEAAPVQEEKKEEKENTILTKNNILVGLESVSKEEAIQAAGKLLHQCGYVNESYIAAMLRREEVTTTYLGMGIAIPHGTNDAKQEVKKTGIVVLQFPDGVDFGEEKAQLVIGIAGVGDEHLDVLARISSSLEDEEVLEKLKTTKDIDYIYECFNKEQED